jgi:hypothetical protein
MTPDIRDLGKKIIGDPYNSIVFGIRSDAQIFVVGGYMRDVLMGQWSLDRDYVVAGPMETLIGEVVRLRGGKMFGLGREGLCRVVLKDGATLDFTPVKENIGKDLSYRDFTINAIAWSPDAGWIDPEGGMEDLKGGLIRMVDAANIISDPLRTLRAYRFAGELSFRIEDATRSALREFSSLIRKTSSERITSEFFKTLNLKNALQIVPMMLEDGLLQCIISSNYKDLERKVNAVGDLFRRSSEALLKYNIRSEEIFAQGLKRLGLLNLEVLLEGCPEHMFVLGRRIIRRLSCFNKGSMMLDRRSDTRAVSRERLFDVFEAAGEASPDLLIIRAMPQYVEDLGEYGRIERKGLLTAEEIRSALGTVDGRTLGKAIREVRKAEFVGQITTAEEALAYLSVSS